MIARKNVNSILLILLITEKFPTLFDTNVFLVSLNDNWKRRREKHEIGRVAKMKNSTRTKSFFYSAVKFVYEAVNGVQDDERKGDRETENPNKMPFIKILSVWESRACL